MHNNGVTNADVAEELGVTKAYVSMILNGARKPKDAKRRLEAAVDAIIDRRNSTNTEA
jgi:predicted transcriptional regulator